MKLAYPIGSPDIKEPFMGFQGKFIEDIKIISSIGYDGIELFMCDPSVFKINELEKMLINLNLSIAAIGTTHLLKQDKLELMSFDDDIRAKAVKRMTELIEFASVFKAPISIGKFRGNIGNRLKEKTLGLLKSSIMEIAEKAEKFNVPILLEVQNVLNIDNLNTVDEAIQFLDSIKSDIISLHLDTLHIDYSEADPIKSIEKTKDKVGYVHCSDSERNTPGKGKIDLLSYIKAFDSIGFDGYFGMEIKQNPDSSVAAKQSFEYMSGLLNKLGIKK